MMRRLFIFCLISYHLHLFNSTITQTNESKCPLPCNCSSQVRIICENFDSFKQLNFSKLRYAKVEYLRLVPKTKLILNNSLDLNGLLFSRNFTVDLANLNGIEITANPFQRATIKYSEIKLLNSDLNFLANNLQLSLNDCEALIASSSFQANIFSSFNSIVFGENVKYTKQLCPVVFKNLKLNSLKIYSLSENENKLDFELVNNPFQLNTFINELFIHESVIALDEFFLYFGLFKNIKALFLLNTYLISIKPNVFKPYMDLKLINFDLPNMSNFLKSNSFNWMESLSTNNLRIRFKLKKNFDYDFPEEDFCRFKYFPGETNVFNEFEIASFDKNETLPCSCTLMSLIRNYKRDSKSVYVGNLERYFECGIELDNQINDCDINQKLNNCQFPIIFTTTKASSSDSLLIKVNWISMSTFSYFFILIMYFFYSFF
jgi:hypothetical protein